MRVGSWVLAIAAFGAAFAGGMAGFVAFRWRQPAGSARGVVSPSAPSDPATPTAATCVAAERDPDPSIETDGGSGIACGPDGCVRFSTPTVGITGRVLDLKGNGAPGLTLRFWREDCKQTVTTADDGAFRLNIDAGAGAYDVDAWIAGGIGSPDGARMHLGAVPAQDGRLQLRFPLECLTLAQGTLTDDRGVPFSGWSVIASDTTQGPLRADPNYATTDEQGRFAIRSWTKYPIDLSLHTPDGRLREIVSTDTDPATGLRRLVAGPAAISGQVRVTSGRTTERAQVRLERSDGTRADRVQRVGTNGRFRFDRVEDDAEYVLTAELAGFEFREPQSCRGGSDGVPLELVHPGDRITGEAQGANGLPLRVTWLWFVTPGATEGFQTITDIDGTFDTVAGGEYEVSAFVPGPDGRTIPGPVLGRCKGGDRGVVLRAAK